MLGAHSSFKEHRDESEAPSATVAGGGFDGELFAAEKIFRLEDGFDPMSQVLIFFFQISLDSTIQPLQICFLLTIG